MLRIEDCSGREVWINWDPSFQGFQLYSGPARTGKYIGCSDTLAEGRSVARDWIALHTLP